MARANTPTWLSLDRYAEIMGISPMHFSQVYSALVPVGQCDEIWYQHAWQDTNKVAREDLAIAIQDAERMIANYVGYNLLPDWTVDEQHENSRPAMPEVYSASSVTPRGQAKSVITRKAHFYSGGVKARSVIQAAAAIVRSDADGDGYSELCTVTVNTTVTACEIRAFTAGKLGADGWEIRPITVTKAANVATITFKIWQVVADEQLERLNSAAIDGDVAASFDTTVDVYRVYNDPQTQVEFLWLDPSCSSCGGTGCTACQLATQSGCLTARNNRLGIAAYSPATWDAAAGSFDADSFTAGRDPDRLRLWYYSGWQAPELACPLTTLDPYWERAIAYLATANLTRPLCGCENVAKFADQLREDLAGTSGQGRTFQVGARVLDNDFGTTRGAVYAWGRANADGRKVQR